MWIIGPFSDKFLYQFLICFWMLYWMIMFFFLLRMEDVCMHYNLIVVALFLEVWVNNGVNFDVRSVSELLRVGMKVEGNFLLKQLRNFNSIPYNTIENYVFSLPECSSSAWFWLTSYQIIVSLKFQFQTSSWKNSVQISNERRIQYVFTNLCEKKLNGRAH